MRVLHLFSNFRWTGPAEPALNLCVALRRAGVATEFACAPGPVKYENRIVTTARDRGIEPILRFSLSKHRRPLANLLDSRALGALLREARYDLVHCHLDNDHRIAASPARKNGLPLVRSSYDGEGFRRRSSAALLTSARFLIEPSRLAFDHDAEVNGFPRDRMAVVPGAVDTERFDPRRQLPDIRAWLGIPREAFVVGIVARMQRHRKYEVFLDAARRLVRQTPHAHIVVVGRGTHEKSVAKEPVAELGLGGHVHFTGYLAGEEYAGVLKAFDTLVYLVPGSDGTCRAVREVLAMGRPAVVARRGMLPEIVDDGATGFVFENNAESLLECLARLAQDRTLRRRLGEAARARAEEAHSLDAQAAAVREVYARVLAP